MSNIIDLTEMLEDYKDGNDDLKKDILIEFRKKLWNSKCKFRKYIKKYSFIIDEDIIHRTDLKELLNQYNSIGYKVNKSIYKSKMNSIDYIKVHINNLYGVKFDNETYLNKQYYDYLLTPKKEYFKIINFIKQGGDESEINIDNIKKIIEDNLNKAKKERMRSINRKCNLKWIDYKKIINKYIERIFNNFIPLEEYEDNDNWEIDDVLIDGWNEDNYIISYICTSLSGYIKTYCRKIQGINQRKKYKFCDNCGKPIEKINNKIKYCKQCAKEIHKQIDREYQRNKYKSKKFLD